MERPLFSEILADRRRELGYSIGQASRVLRLKEDVLIAFEDGDFESMPKSGYAQGMLASYARYLGLDATEICDIYLEDLESYRHGRRSQKNAGAASGGAAIKRSQSPSVGQPYVPKRGLLPTSGGVAGDLGSFATTRVRSRDQYADDRDRREDGDSTPYVEYPQGRPYTGRRPTRTGRERVSGRHSRNRGDIDMMSPNDYEYEDDLRFGRDVRSYEAASTGRGRRRSRRNGERQQRPSVRRRERSGSSTSRRDGRRGRRDGGSGRRSRRESQQPRPNRTLILVVGAVAILSVIIVLTAVSCIRQGSDEARTVPVSTAESGSQDNSQSTSEKTQDTKGQSTGSEGTAEQGTSTGTSAHTGGSSNSANTGKNNATEKETSVSVSVADGEVTWLEIECDGKSDVAETITGPWQKTYTVTDSMTIQAGETSSVAVVQNGRQLQFESITAGIGTLRIQGTKKTNKETEKNGDGANGTNSKGSESSSTDKTGSASNGSEEGESEDSSGYTTIDGVTYDVYGNVVSTEGGGSTSGGNTSNGSNGAGTTNSRNGTSRSSRG